MRHRSKGLFFRHPILFLIAVLTSLLLFFYVVPETMYYFQVKNLITSEIQNGKIQDKSDNKQTREFFKENPKQAASDVTDFQGSNGHNGYLVASLKNDKSLGIFVNYKAVGPYLTDLEITSAHLHSKDDPR